MKPKNQQRINLNLLINMSLNYLNLEAITKLLKNIFKNLLLNC